MPTKRCCRGVVQALSLDLLLSLAVIFTLLALLMYVLSTLWYTCCGTGFCPTLLKDPSPHEFGRYVRLHFERRLITTSHTDCACDHSQETNAKVSPHFLLRCLCCPCAHFQVFHDQLCCHHCLVIEARPLTNSLKMLFCARESTIRDQ